ncbi:hypothetical protein CEXT_669351 [Caerostris extrusa]|uniref:Uncharacterized protein n=1 Tax=Caerostris extrusa TaxID=172846 RepID=A0AAV4RV38_CAEEX|nr:hypothetical protein CEXT_669351 [Caerostris extrusa]
MNFTLTWSAKLFLLRISTAFNCVFLLSVKSCSPPRLSNSQWNFIMERAKRDFSDPWSFEECQRTVPNRSPSRTTEQEKKLADCDANNREKGCQCPISGFINRRQKVGRKVGPTMSSASISTFDDIECCDYLQTESYVVIRQDGRAVIRSLKTENLWVRRPIIRSRNRIFSFLINPLPLVPPPPKWGRDNNRSL